MRKLLRRIASSLLLRVALALALVGILPVAILSYRLIDLNQGAMEDELRLTHVRVARSTAAEISARVGAFRALASGLARSDALRAPRSDSARALLGQSLGAWADLGVAAILVVTPSGERVIGAQLNDDQVRAWSERMSQAPANLEVHAETIGDALVLRIAAPLDGERGQAWLVADGDWVRVSVNNYELGKDAQVALATRDRRAIVGDLEAFSVELLEHAESPWLDGFQSTAEVDAEDGFIGAHAAVTGTNWVVLSQQPLDVAHAVALTMRRNARTAIALAAGLVLLLSTLAWASVVRPIRQLAQAQRRLAGLGPASGSGEIGQLKSAFEALEQRIKQQQALDEVFLGRYQVRKVLGSGAMGTVFLGFDPKLERPVALKTLRLDRDLSAKRRDELLSRLVKEAVVTAKFNHPNIVAIYDVQEGDGSAFLAMEYVDGMALEPYVWSKRLDGDQTIALGVELANGLSAAHEHGLVHRDIKPANILLGKDGAIKITDFGIAELLTAMASSQDVVFGTPGYLPPEALQGKGHDQASDLFALGAVLYFCITGHRPFEGKTVKEVIRKTMFGTPKPPSKWAPETPDELEALLLSLLASNPKRRPTSASNVADRLARLAQARGARWRPPGDAESAEREGSADDAGYLPTIRLTGEERTPPPEERS